jgi:hypothetical protein
MDSGTYRVKIISMNSCGEYVLQHHVAIADVYIIDNNDPEFRIQSILPNPIENQATINFIIPIAAEVSFTLIDLAGREIMELHRGFFNDGNNTIHIYDKLNQMSSGSYFVILESRGRKASMHITISR